MYRKLVWNGFALVAFCGCHGPHPDLEVLDGWLASEGLPAKNLKVIWGNATVVTDESGYFSFQATDVADSAQRLEVLVSNEHTETILHRNHEEHDIMLPSQNRFERMVTVELEGYRDGDSVSVVRATGRRIGGNWFWQYGYFFGNVPVLEQGGSTWRLVGRLVNDLEAWANFVITRDNNGRITGLGSCWETGVQTNEDLRCSVDLGEGTLVGFPMDTVGLDSGLWMNYVELSNVELPGLRVRLPLGSQYLSMEPPLQEDLILPGWEILQRVCIYGTDLEAGGCDRDSVILEGSACSEEEGIPNAIDSVLGTVSLVEEVFGARPTLTWSVSDPNVPVTAFLGNAYWWSPRRSWNMQGLERLKKNQISFPSQPQAFTPEEEGELLLWAEPLPGVRSQCYKSFAFDYLR